MLSPRLRERLSRLARGMAEPEATVAPPLACAGPDPAAEKTVASPPPVVPWGLQYEVPGDAELLEGAAGSCLVVAPDLTALLPDHMERLEAWSGLPEQPWGHWERRLFLDIETAGLSAAPLFLVGVLLAEPGALRLRQFLARDYVEEPALLAYFCEWAGSYNTLITFNGRTFDLPYLLDRAIYHRCAAAFAQEHIDLLTLSRRRWRGQFRDCRLTTLEIHICGRRRLNDVSGADIPQLYHDFVRTGEWGLLAPVLYHNALDLLSMAELASKL